ncbi:hypothetical protein KHF85_12680 [Xanthomonas translucens pv. graminis]|uniref:hypothetical protein n=1 Tax=Xanthomonas graminis TaxID=3390026 RepID=UPI0025410267|nr:hypothetical protein [Xanthomonas translucens]WIH03736.1 hypothetical protein KHF85_12680 [Xanthomonas translucens pv. graminis]
MSGAAAPQARQETSHCGTGGTFKTDAVIDPEMAARQGVACGVADATHFRTRRCRDPAHAARTADRVVVLVAAMSEGTCVAAPDGGWRWCWVSMPDVPSCL